MNVETIDHPGTRAERCLGRLCSPATGLKFRQSDRGTGEFVITDLSTAAIERSLPETGDEPISVTVGGGGTTVTAATLTTLGEFLERYSMYWPIEDSIVETHTGLRTAGESVVDIEYLQIWDEDDIDGAGFEWFDADTTTEWVPGTNLHTGKDIFVPADLVTFAYAHGDAASLPSSTSGNACGSSLAGALVRSLYEQVERDAVMRTWYEQRTPTRLDVSAFDGLERFRRQITPTGYRLHVLELPTPTACSAVGAALVNEGDRVPKFRLFAGADRTIPVAVRDALSETAEGLLQTKYRLAAGNTPDEDIDISSVYDFDGNVQYYMRPENFEAVTHLLEGDVQVVSPDVTAAKDTPASESLERELDNPQRELKYALEAVTASIDATPISVDLTPRDVRELGMYATSVYVPELVDISPPALPPIDHPGLSRLETRAPHPFP
jgi:ribosomal protein S12 methylthiotransferase accessory factor